MCPPMDDFCRLLIPFANSVDPDQAWQNSAARICDKYQTFLNWPIQFGLSLHLHPFFLLRFCKGSGDTAPMWSLVWSFDVRLCDMYQTLMNWPIKSKWVWSGSTAITHFSSTHGTVRSSHRLLTSRKTVKVRHHALSFSSRWLQN